MTVKAPPTLVVIALAVPNCVATPLVNDALPLAPVVFNATTPDKLLAEVNVIVVLEAVVWKLAAPATVIAFACERLPVESVTVNVPPTLVAMVFAVPNEVATLFVKAALPLAPVVFNATVPDKLFAEFKVIVALEAVVWKLAAPATVIALACERLPVESVTVNVPPTLVAMLFAVPNEVATLFVNAALPLAPVVFNATVPDKLLAEFKVIVAFDAVVWKLEAPATVMALACERLPVESVIVNVPPTLVAMLFAVPNEVATLLVKAALPLAPVVFNATVPDKLLAEFKVMVALEAVVWKLELPATVNAAACERLPVESVIVNVPPTLVAMVFAVPNEVATLFVKAALPLAPVVFNATVPDKLFVAVVKVIVALEALVWKLAAPTTVIALACERLPIESVIFNVPPTLVVMLFAVPNEVATLFVNAALPLAPVVFSATVPDKLLAEFKVIVAFDAVVWKLALPATVNAVACERLPIESVTVNVPPTLVAMLFAVPNDVATLFVKAALPLAPVVFNATVPDKLLAEFKVIVAI